MTRRPDLQPEDPPAWPCLRVAREGLTLDVLVAPNAKRTEVMGLHDGALRLRLAAPPVDGAANQALLAFLADALAAPRQAVQLLRGAGTRRKQLRLEVPRARVEAWLGDVLRG